MDKQGQNGLPLLQKVYDIILWLYPRVNKFPKSQRFVLGQRLENSSLALLEYILQAVAEDRVNRLEAIKKASIELDKFRFLIRLSCDLGFISARQYGFAAEHITEAGSMIGGWKKSCYAKQN